jgi:hypothetical protein
VKIESITIRLVPTDGDEPEVREIVVRADRIDGQLRYPREVKLAAALIDWIKSW